MAPLRSSTEGAIPLICPGVIKPRFCWGCKEAFGAAGKTRPTNNVRKKQNFIPVRDGPKAGFEKIIPFSGFCTGSKGGNRFRLLRSALEQAPLSEFPQGLRRSRESTVLPFSPIDSTDTIDGIRFPTLTCAGIRKISIFPKCCCPALRQCILCLCFVPGGRSGGPTFRKRRVRFTASDRCALPRHLIAFGVRSFRCKRDGKVLRAPGQKIPPQHRGGKALFGIGQESQSSPFDALFRTKKEGWHKASPLLGNS